MLTLEDVFPPFALRSGRLVGMQDVRATDFAPTR